MIGAVVYKLRAENSASLPFINGRLMHAAVFITPTFKIPINFEMFQAYTKFLKNIFGFIVDGVIKFLAKFRLPSEI